MNIEEKKELANQIVAKVEELNELAQKAKEEGLDIDLRSGIYPFGQGDNSSPKHYVVKITDVQVLACLDDRKNEPKLITPRTITGLSDEFTGLKI